MTKQEPVEIAGLETFKTATELNLSETHRCALIKALAYLEAGKLDHEEIEPHHIRFTMRKWGGSCGTACCIGGSAEALGGLEYRTLGQACKTNKRLGELFYPGGWPHLFDPGAHHKGWNATPKQAATVLRGYLTTGKADWDQI